MEQTIGQVSDKFEISKKTKKRCYIKISITTMGLTLSIPQCLPGSMFHISDVGNLRVNMHQNSFHSFAYNSDGNLHNMFHITNDL